jgi:hypothetical protein
MKGPHRSRRIAASSLLFIALAHRSGRADTGHLQLALRGPAECGSAARIEAAVATMVRSAGPPLQATLDITRVEGRYVAVVRTKPAGERRLEASECHAIVEAASVVLALAIDPNARLTEGSENYDYDRPRPAPPDLAEPTITAALALDTSTLPRAALGAAFGAGLVWPRWSVRLELDIWSSQDTVSASSPSRGGRFGWWTGGLSFCATPLRQSWAALCLSPEIGRLAGTGIGDGVAQPQSSSALWVAAGAGPALEWRLTRRWGLRGEALAVLTVLGRHPFVWDVGDSALLIHRPGRLSGRLYLGLTARF